MRPALALLIILAPLGCTVEGEDVMTTFADPTSNPSGNPTTTNDGDTESSQGSSDTESAQTGSDDATTASPTSGSGGGSETGPAPDEQPETGMYSECMTVGDCIGQTTCVIVPGAEMGFCSSSCADPGMDCVANPGASSTAAPSCVDDGGGLQVCALACDGGLTCPGGMECLALGGAMVCV